MVWQGMRVPMGPIDIHVEEAGEGDPVVMIHSSGLSSRQWRGLARVLAPSHRAVMPDLLGSGDTRGWIPRDDFAIDEDAELIRTVIRALDRPVHLVGHSYGGMLALLVARTSPAAQVRTIAVYEPVAWGVAIDEPGGPVQEQLDRFGDDFFAAATGGTDAWYRRFIDFWNGDGAWAALPAAQRAAFVAAGPKVFREVRALCCDRTPASAYRGIEAPTLILAGDRSPLAERRVCEVLAATIPGAELIVAPGLGHMGPLVRPDEVNPRIAAHLRARTT
jgi:pimeloyl-ACP methyl ester carboxylesterase